MERRKDDFKEELLSEGKRSRSGIHVSPYVLLSVTLLNVFLLASTAALAIYLRETSVVVQRRVARQDDYPPVRDPDFGFTSYLYCCRMLDQTTLQQLCTQAAGTNTTTQRAPPASLPQTPTPRPPTAVPTVRSKRMTPPPRATTTKPANTASILTTPSVLDQDNEFNRLRLPRHLRPSHYNIHWKPDFYHSSPSDFSLEGSVEVFLLCHSPTLNVSLNVRKLVVDRTSVKVTGRHDNASIAWTEIVEDEATEVLNITLERSLLIGEEIVVSMRFSGEINGDSVGIYWSRYLAVNETRYIVSTQMEATEARRAFPCFDDPEVKATFTVAVERQPHVFTLANTPLNFTTSSSGSPGWVLDVFQTSKPMSTYLVAIVVSDFTSINATTNGRSLTKVGLWAQDSFTTAGFLNYASVVSVKSIEFFEEYFNYSYTWPKMDMVAVPKLSFGGMENWGLVTYQISKLLFDQDYSDSEEKQNAAGIIAHEVLHNWIGNTVTIRWWDNLWLTEGMAKYFQYVATQILNPSWDAEQLFISQVFYPRAIWNDDSGSTTPLYNPFLYTNADLDNTFNDIEYSKGASIIRMLSKLIVGEDVFQKALQSYILKHQYGNVDHNDLINSMTQALVASGSAVDFDLREVLLTWIKQMGFPLVTVSRPSNDSSDERMTVTQRLYLFQPNATLEEAYPSPYGYLWEIPLSYITSFNSTPVRVWMHKVENMSIQLTRPLTGNEWILVNPNLYGYYRVNYDEGNWRSLADQLISDHTRIPLINRAQLIDDSFTLAVSGNVSQVTGLRLTEYFSREQEYLPWETFKDNVNLVLRRFQDNGMFLDRLQSYVRSLLMSNYNSLGWDSKPDDNITVIYLRRLIIETACGFDSDQCINEALNRFRLWRANAFNNSLLPPDQRFAVYCTAAAHGDYEDWEVLVSRYKATKSHFSSESSKLVKALTCTRNITIIQRLLDSVQAQETSFVEPSDYFYIRWYISISKQGYMAAWEHLYKYGSATIGQMDILRGLSNVISTKSEADKFDSYLKQYPATNSNEAASLRRTIQQYINWRLRNAKEMNDWLTGLNF